MGCMRTEATLRARKKNHQQKLHVFFYIFSVHKHLLSTKIFEVAVFFLSVVVSKPLCLEDYCESLESDLGKYKTQLDLF